MKADYIIVINKNQRKLKLKDIITEIIVDGNINNSKLDTSERLVDKENNSEKI